MMKLPVTLAVAAALTCLSSSAFAKYSLPKSIKDPQLVEAALNSIASNQKVLDEARTILRCNGDLRACMQKDVDVYQTAEEFYVQWTDEDVSCSLRVHFNLNKQVISSSDAADHNWVCHADH